jgi:ABC-type lipoprotein release transport system permease subunit
MTLDGATWLIIAAGATGLALVAAAALVLASPVYKHVVCAKYLFSGWKAVVPLVSALPAALGVFLLILVFSIMDGFVQETREMTRGTLADIIVDAHMEGVPYYDEFISHVRRIAGVEDATPIIQTYAVARIKPRIQAVRPLVRPCLLLGIRPAEKAGMGRFHEYLQRQRAEEFPAARLLVPPPEWTADAPAGPAAPGCIAGIGLVGAPMAGQKAETVWQGIGRKVLAGALALAAAVTTLFIWAARRRRRGRTGWTLALGVSVAATAALAVATALVPVEQGTILRDEVIDYPLLDYGQDLVVSTIPINPSGSVAMEAGGLPRVQSRRLTLVDTFKSGFWEADSSHVYVDFDVAQKMAGMDAPADGGPARANQVHIKVAEKADAGAVVEDVRAAWQTFMRDRPEVGILHLTINTWETQQRLILTVVEVEKNITALMLGLMFFGFVVLVALISYVMAYIKSRDVGILKAVGARDWGVGSMFLGYGFVIGLIGTVLGLAGALLMLWQLDTIEVWVNQTLNIDVFPREMYYFESIPRSVSPLWCASISVAVLVLSTLASMAGGLLAAFKQPVETLRYE